MQPANKYHKFIKFMLNSLVDKVNSTAYSKLCASEENCKSMKHPARACKGKSNFSIRKLVMET
jgi:hypothetical protein